MCRQIRTDRPIAYPSNIQSKYFHLGVTLTQQRTTDIDTGWNRLSLTKTQTPLENVRAIQKTRGSFVRKDFGGAFRGLWKG